MADDKTRRMADPGIGMVVLQTLRAMSIIALLTAATSCWALIIKMNTTRDFFVFDGASLFFTSCIAFFLIISELPVQRAYFSDNWPCLGDYTGFVWLGLAMVIVGCNILGKLNLPANDAKEIGLAWWRLVLAGGILSLSFGVFNIVCSFVWSDRKNGITARDVRAKGKLAESEKQLPLDKTFYSHSTAHSTSKPSLRYEKTRTKFMSMFWRKDREEDVEKEGSRPWISAPISSSGSGPRTATPVHDEEPHAMTSDAYTHNNTSPLVPGVQRPDSAMHPLRRADSTGRSSHYSTAHFSRFGGI